MRFAISEDGRRSPAGFVHGRRAARNFETDDLLDRVVHFAPDLDGEQRREFGRELSG